MYPRARSAKIVPSSSAAPARLSSAFGGEAFLFSRVLALLSTFFQFLQANQLTLFPQDIALIFTQTGCTNTTQMLDIPWTPQIEYRVIANDEGAGNRQQFTSDAPE